MHGLVFCFPDKIAKTTRIFRNTHTNTHTTGYSFEQDRSERVSTWLYCLHVRMWAVVEFVSSNKDHISCQIKYAQDQGQYLTRSHYLHLQTCSQPRRSQKACWVGKSWRRLVSRAPRAPQPRTCRTTWSSCGRRASCLCKCLLCGQCLPKPGLSAQQLIPSAMCWRSSLASLNPGYEHHVASDISNYGVVTKYLGD